MPIVYCDGDGRVLSVQHLQHHSDTRPDPRNTGPPPGEAFSVGVDRDLGNRIAKRPASYRFDGTTMAKVPGDSRASQTLTTRSRKFARQVAVKRKAAQAAGDVAAMVTPESPPGS